MVIVPDRRGSGPRAATEMRLACPRSFPMDLIVRTGAEVRRRLREGDSFLREVTTKGIVLRSSSWGLAKDRAETRRSQRSQR